MSNESAPRWPLSIEILEIVAALLCAFLPFVERRLPIAVAAVALFATAVALRFFGIARQEPEPQPEAETAIVGDDHPMARPLISSEASSAL